MLRKIFLTAGFGVPILLFLLVVFLSGRAFVSAPTSLVKPSMYVQQVNVQQVISPHSASRSLLNGKTASLSWIFGRDCQAGVHAYQKSALADPNAALIGTGWVDPTNGNLINGKHNICVRGSLSMDNVVQLVHSRGGMAYLTITMDTDGSAEAWTTQQAAEYVAKAATDPGFIKPILNEAIRGQYDGVIMDLEGVDRTYPAIQQIFAIYNQRVWAALQPLHKLYGIALIHKISDHDAYSYLNAFENWRLLGHSADFIVVMAVDQSYLTPGPTVSNPWLNQLLAYTLQTMPGMLPHIIWELPLYGNIWHWENGGWIFDGDVTFQDAQTVVDGLSPTQIDLNASNVHDVYSPHVVYTDTSGVRHALWYLSARSLYNIVTNFWQVLQREPQFASGRLAIAVWWRTTSEPQQFWPLLDQLY